MEAKVFVQNFTSQFDETDTSSCSIHTRFRDIEGWSSLVALSIIAMVDEEYKVKLTGDDIRSSTSIEDIYNIVNSRM